MSRWLSWLSELQPTLFCEVSPDLAKEVGLEHGGWATIATMRGEIECRVMVTSRVQPLRIGKRLVHTIGLPYHWSGIGRVTGDTVNELVGFVADPNVNIQESKALTANIVAGRRGHTRRAATDATMPYAPPVPARDLPGVGQKQNEPPEVKK
jgi:formate dehydrogenase major subunit